MTGVENERLATLETKVSRIEADVNEIKSDVKSLVTSHATMAATASALAAAEAAEKLSRRNNGQWLRFFAERAIAILALVVAAYAVIKG